MNAQPAWTIETRDYSATKISGKIIRLFCERDTFCAGVIRSDDGPMMERDCRFKIKDHVTVGQSINATGKWVNTQYGMTFDISTLTYEAPHVDSPEGLASYLQTMNGSDGIGPVKAMLIAKEFTVAEFDQIIRTDPQRIADVAKVKVERVLSLQHSWCEFADVNAIAVWLASYGLQPGQIRKIAQRYGNEAETILRTNPYELHKTIEGIGFLRNDEIAQKMGVAKTDPNRIRAGINYQINDDANSSGNTYVARAELISNTVKLLYMDVLDARVRIDHEIDWLCESGELVSIEQGGIAYVGAAWLYRMEMSLLGMLTDDRKRVEPIEIDISDDNVAEDKKPTDEQRQARSAALEHPISIITGGAGVGKSCAITHIVAALQQADQTATICTPTGKAARRLQADTIFAQTIHRTLGVDTMTGGFAHDEDNPLDTDCVIVDEVSMCAIPLLHSLCRAIDHSRTRLVLVGDYNQLPPIGPGNTLRDLVDNQLVPVTRLTKCHRNAGKLKENCAGILNGHVNRQPEYVSPEIKPELAARNVPAWSIISDCENTERVVGLLRLLHDTQFAAWGFDPMTDCQIITPQNPGPLGVNRLNLELQRVEHAKRGVILPPVLDIKSRPKLLTGDKIMQTKNDSKLNLMNGTQGVIREIVDQDDPQNPLNKLSYYVIQFDDRDEPLRLQIGADESKHLVLAYAVTVHKVQGSQYPCVVSVVHKSHTYMLSRNLLYTAVTRARYCSIILGENSGIRRAASAKGDMERRTWTSLVSKGDSTCHA